MTETAKREGVSRKSKHGTYSINTFQTNVRLGRELHRRAEKRAEELGIIFADYIRRLVENDTRNVELTADDYTLIAERVRHETELRAKRGL